MSVSIKLSAKYLFFFLILTAAMFLPFSPASVSPSGSSDTAVSDGGYIAVLDTSLLSAEEVSTPSDLTALLPVSGVCLDISFPYALLAPSDTASDSDMLRNLQDCPFICSLEPDYIISSTSFTNDTYSDRQWSLQDSSYGIHAEQAWSALSRMAPARTVIVAVIDTGIDYQHPDLASSMWTNSGEIPDDGIDNDGNGYVDDVYGWDFYHGDNTVCHYSYDEEKGTLTADPEDSDNHGTHVAGILAAAADNGIGIAGAAGSLPVRIMSLKALGGGTASSPGTGSTFQTIKAIQYATNMGADICSLSWGNSIYSSSLEQAIRESDMLFVAAAGNTSSNNNSSPVYPASLALDNIISVAGTNRKGELAGFSNYGTSSVDMAAPAEKITSTIVGSYAAMSGTSMAVPHVSAIAAMLYSTSEHLFASNVKEILLTSGRYLPSLDGYLRHPVIPDAAAAVDCAGYLRQDRNAPEFDWNITYETANIEVQIHATDAGGSGIRTIRYIFGRKDIEAFRHGTEGLSSDDGVAWLSKPGNYTFYVSDYAGNETIHIIPVRQIPSETLLLPHTRKTMKTGWTYQLKYEILPEDYTDAVSFISSDPEILQVDRNGLVTAHKTGRATIEIRTASGLTEYCCFTVRPAAESNTP